MIPLTVQCGKYHITIFFPKLQPVSDTVGQKKAGFNQLVSKVYSLLKFHSVSNIICHVACEVPIETFTAQQEATKVMHKVWRCVFNVNHLQVVAFLNVSDKTVQVKSDKLNKIPGRLTFFQFRCKIDIIDITPVFVRKFRLSFLPPISPAPAQFNNKGRQDPHLCL